MSSDQLDLMLECIETLGLAACRNAQALELGPGTGSIGEIECVCNDAHAVSRVIDAVGHPLQLLLRDDVLGVVEEGPSLETGLAHLRMPNEVGLVGLIKSLR